MYVPWPIRFPAHWCADYSKYRGFLAGGISTASSLLLFLEHGSAAKTLISHPHNTASYAGYFSIFPRFFNNLRFSFVVKIARQTLVLIESFQKTPEDCKTWFLVRLSFFKKGVSCVGHGERRSSCHSLWREFTCFQLHTRWMPWSFPRLSNDWCIIS